MGEARAGNQYTIQIVVQLSAELSSFPFIRCLASQHLVAARPGISQRREAIAACARGYINISFLLPRLSPEHIYQKLLRLGRKSYKVLLLLPIMAALKDLEQAHQQGIVLGLKGVAGVKPRYDIDVFLLKYPDTFNLFCLALGELMNDSDTTKIMGYYQIAGIHGLPSATWDGVSSTTKSRIGTMIDDAVQYSGYCVHGFPEFPTWHRPYLAMLEQSIYLKMLEIAGRFPQKADQDTYRTAAQDFRLPYWDYFRARGQNARYGGQTFSWDFKAPRIFTETEIMLDVPGKGFVRSPNPLHSFSFLKGGKLPQKDWDLAPLRLSAYNKDQTLRHPQNASPVDHLNLTLNTRWYNALWDISDAISDYDHEKMTGFVTNYYRSLEGSE